MAIKETSRVNEHLEPCLFIAFENGKKVECLIDTGFSGALCLPRHLMEELALTKIFEEEIFGIGLHQEVVDVALASIVWLGHKTEIEVLINNGDDRLLGSELLAGKVLNINYKKGTLSIKDA